MGVKIKSKAISVYDNGNKVELDAFRGDSYILTDQDKTDIATIAGDKINLAGKQDVISDLDTIRSGAAKGATSIQSLDGYATESYVDTKVSDLVDSAPETLDTLKELSAALGNDENFATTVSTEIGKKVDKDALFDAGIKSISWAVSRSEITVTTVEDPYKSQRPSGTNTRYWAEFEGCPLLINRKTYRVTFNGTLYNNMVCQYGILINDGTAGKNSSSTNSEVGGAWSIIGNKYLYDSRYEDTGEPFCIMYIDHGGMNTDSSYYYGYSVGHGILLTSSASTSTLKIETAAINKNNIPDELLNNYGYGDKLYQNISSSSYPRTSLGQGNIVGRGDFAIGNSNISTGTFSCCIGSSNNASYHSSYAEGVLNTSTALASHAEGWQTKASAEASHSEGYATETTISCAHAEGYNSKCSGYGGHAEGYQSSSTAMAAHSEGGFTSSSGRASHAEGQGSSASGTESHAEGKYTIAASASQHAEGQYNIKDESSKYLHIVGNGASDTARSNAHTLDWNGNAEFQGDITAYGCGSSNTAITMSGLKSEVDGKQDTLTDDDKQAIADLHSDKVTDVQVAGTSVLTDGVANVPAANIKQFGVTKSYNGIPDYGVVFESAGAYILSASNSNIDARTSDYKPIVPKNLDYAVKAALTDSKKVTYSDTEITSAQETIGIKVMTAEEYALITPNESTIYLISG